MARRRPISRVDRTSSDKPSTIIAGKTHANQPAPAEGAECVASVISGIACGSSRSILAQDFVPHTGMASGVKIRWAWLD